MVFGILNTISEFIAFFMVLLLALLGTALTAVAGANAGVMALPITYTITLLAHAICTIVMVSGSNIATAYFSQSVARF